jgi:hypothetical protein
MPSVMDAPELVEYVETHDRTLETSAWPQPRRARPGFWRPLAHTITTYLKPTPYEPHAPLSRAHCPFEAPMDRLVREHPSLSVYALALI